jgi:hypothetical protein
MAYVGIDTQGVRQLGEALQEAAARADGVRREVAVALDLADLASDVPARIGVVEDGFATLGAGVLDKAELAERFLADPQGTSASLAVPEAALGATLSGLLGMAGATELRGFLTGLPASGADPELDAALARLDPVLLPTLLAGERPELTAQQLADLRLLALRLGIEHAGPPIAAGDPEQPVGDGFFAALRRRSSHSDTEVFWNDFWADGRTVEEVLADPERLLEWVAGTFELDRRLAAATELPTLGDMVASVDFATTRTVDNDPEELAALVAGVEQEFAAIADWLPAHLVGQDRSGPDAIQLEQTLAFAARVGWPDPGTGAATEQQRFDSAVAFLRANRALQSALLPTGFEGIAEPLTFFNGSGIRLTLDLGRRSGAIDDAYLGNLAAVVDQQLAGSGVDLSGPEPVELTEPLQAQLFALVASQLPGSLVESPAIQSQFVAALGYLRQATSGPELRQRIIDVVAAFRTLAVAGAPALTERQLVGVVGEQALRVLGRGRLRLRSQERVRKNPEFLLVARQWGVPGSHKETIGKYKFRWGFDELGELTQLKRKKKSFWSRAWDTIKSIGNAIWESWKDNPFKAIFQVGKLALSALAFAVPGLQGLGVAAFALNLAGAAYHAIEGDWLAAIGSGLAAFTGGASDLVGIEQAAFVKDLVDTDTLAILTNAKRAFDIGTSAFQALQADSLLGAITGGLGAVGTALHSGGGLLGSLNVIDADLAGQLARLGTSVRDVARLVTPAAGLVQALENGDALAAFANGLSVAAAGAGALLNPKGAFTDPSIVAGTLFEFDRETQQAIASIARGTGVAANVTAAINAANRGDAFLAGSLLARAVQVLNRPQTTVTGNRALVAQRITELGRVLQAVYRSRNPNAAAAAGPQVVQGLNGVLSALNTPLIPPLPARNPARQAVGEAGTEEVTVFGGTNLSGQGQLTLAQAGSSGGQGPTVRLQDGRTIQTRPGGEYFAPPGSTITMPGGAEIEAPEPGLFSFPDGTRIHIDEVPTSSLDSDELFGTAGLGPETVLVEEFQTSLLAAAGPQPGPELPGPGTLSAMPGVLVSHDSTGVPSGVPGSIAPFLPVGMALGPPVPEKPIKIAVIGDSFISGEGSVTEDGENDYISWGTGLGRLPADAHQSRQAGAIQAVQQLQAIDPTATIRVTYTAAGGQTETHPPLVGQGEGPVFEVTFAAESGATSASILGLERNKPDGPSAAQIEAVKDADVVIVSVGGNDAKVADALTSGLFKVVPPFDGTGDIQDSIERIPERTNQVPLVLQHVLGEASPTAQVLVLGYPNILAPLGPDGTSGPLGSGASGLTTNLTPEELRLFAHYGSTLDNTVAGYVGAANPRPGQSIAYLPQWGAWGAQNTLGGSDPAANEAVWQNWYSLLPENDSYHPNLRGQQLIAATLAQPVQDAVARALGQPVQYAPSDVFFALSGGTLPAEWDNALARVDLQTQDAQGVVVPGISVSETPVAPSIVDFAAPAVPPFGWEESDPWAQPVTDYSAWQDGLDGSALGLGGDVYYPPLPDYLDGDDFSAGYSYQDPLDSLTATASWDTGTGYDDVWADAWDSPMETYSGDTLSAMDFL